MTPPDLEHEAIEDTARAVVHEAALGSRDFALATDTLTMCAALREERAARLAERDEAREQVRSLTVERDAVAARLSVSERENGRLDARLSRAMEALAGRQVGLSTKAPQHDEWCARGRGECDCGLAALRAALAPEEAPRGP